MNLELKKTLSTQVNESEGIIPLHSRRKRMASIVRPSTARIKLIVGAVVVSLTSIAFTTSAHAQRKVELSVDLSKAGPRIDRNLFGQFAEHLGSGVYEGIWVGPNSKIANTRGI